VRRTKFRSKRLDTAGGSVRNPLKAIRDLCQLVSVLIANRGATHRFVLFNIQRVTALDSDKSTLGVARRGGFAFELGQEVFGSHQRNPSLLIAESRAAIRTITELRFELGYSSGESENVLVAPSPSSHLLPGDNLEARDPAANARGSKGNVPGFRR
jgi:hypothetical protein